MLEEKNHNRPSGKDIPSLLVGYARHRFPHACSGLNGVTSYVAPGYAELSCHDPFVTVDFASYTWWLFMVPPTLVLSQWWWAPLELKDTLLKRP